MVDGKAAVGVLDGCCCAWQFFFVMAVVVVVDVVAVVENNGTPHHLVYSTPLLPGTRIHVQVNERSKKDHS